MGCGGRDVDSDAPKTGERPGFKSESLLLGIGYGRKVKASSPLGPTDSET